MSRRDQSSSPSESELLFELEFELLSELELELLSELEFELEFELLSELELEFESELEFELEFEFESELEFELLSELHEKSVWPDEVWQSSSASAGTARNEVAMKATVAALARIFIGGVLPFEKQPSVTAQG